MLFSSMEFLLLFLPGTLGVYYILPKRCRNYWLLAASLVFYAWGEPRFVLNMVFTIIWSYLAALLLRSLKKGSTARKLVLAAALAADLGQLFVFKYLSYTVSILEKLLPARALGNFELNIALPIGISFFTFQAMSYIIDVYRERVPAQRNPAYLGLYISFFPQLIAGPIVRYSTVMEQLKERSISFELFSEGVRRFVLGFNKKLLLANILAELADTAFSAGELSPAMAWLGGIAYTLQIFFDFCGYSDMAIGLGMMFGFRFLENFNYPYISKTITEFWRRWHISLGSWFRDYLYFPLGGSRVNSRARLVFNLAVVWLATGIWHGANVTFLLWGLLHGAVVIFEKLCSIPKRLEGRRGFGQLYRVFTLLIVVFGWVLFRAADFNEARLYLATMLGLTGSASNEQFLFYLREYAVFLFMGILCSTPFFPMLEKRISAKCKGAEALVYGCSCAVQLVLFVIGISCLVMDAHNPFIYFNF